MTEDRLPRRLCVVWFTDLVGYSRLSAQDEDRAIALVRRFQAAMRAAVLADRGRIVKFIGDAARAPRTLCRVTRSDRADESREPPVGAPALGSALHPDQV